MRCTSGAPAKSASAAYEKHCHDNDDGYQREHSQSVGTAVGIHFLLIDYGGFADVVVAHVLTFLKVEYWEKNHCGILMSQLS